MRIFRIFFLLFFLSISMLSGQVSNNTGDKEKTLQLSSLFSDHMVLQQKKAVRIFGCYQPYKNITAIASWGATVSAKSDSSGLWQLNLDVPKAGRGPYTLTFKSGNTSIILNDILIGEVWLAAGQSNMDISLGGWLPKDSINNSKKEIAKANYPNIRFFKVPFGISATPLNAVKGSWVKTSPQTAADFSATAYFYAQKLYQELNVPIGIIQSSIGGTPAEAWTSRKSLQKIKDFDQALEGITGIQNSADSWVKKWPQQKVPATAGEWQKTIEADEVAAQVGFNDSKWSKLTLPGRIDKINAVEFNGGIWLRKQIFIEDISTDYTLKIEEIDDMDLTYFNGVKIGGLLGNGHAMEKREMIIPKALLKKGANIIAMCVIDTGGPGNVNGSMTISNSNNVVISLAGEWNSKVISEIFNDTLFKYNIEADLSKRPTIFEMNSNTPSALYNAMINPLIKYPIKGVIWYQGESNVGRAEQYKSLFPLMIEDWREKWGYDFPFYYTQIAPYSYPDTFQKEQSQKLRDAQRLALKVPKTGMAVTLDIGRLDSAHPSEKKTVGQRLARFSLSNEYNKSLVNSGPLFKEVKKNGNTLVVSFKKESIGSGLLATEKGLTNFEIAGSDKVYVGANVIIQEDVLIASSPSVQNPIFIRYAWSDASAATLFNKEGLPASTFTSEP
jgi:sialate O-acetylesterase